MWTGKSSWPGLRQTNKHIILAVGIFHIKSIVSTFGIFFVVCWKKERLKNEKYTCLLKSVNLVISWHAFVIRNLFHFDCIHKLGNYIQVFIIEKKNFYSKHNLLVSLKSYVFSKGHRFSSFHPTNSLLCFRGRSVGYTLPFVFFGGGVLHIFPQYIIKVNFWVRINLHPTNNFFFGVEWSVQYISSEGDILLFKVTHHKSSILG